MLKDQNSRLGAAFIIGIAVGAGSLWLWSNRSAGALDGVPLTEIDENSIAGIAGGLNEIDLAATSTRDAILRVADQNPGKKVVIAQTNFEKPAWVVIHDKTDGKPGNILGAKLFDKGKQSGIVELLRSTTLGGSYYAVLHNYDGAKRPFNYATDLPIKGADGEPVMVEFAVTKAKD